jgi:hypothetical protein
MAMCLASGSIPSPPPVRAGESVPVPEDADMDRARLNLLQINRIHPAVKRFETILKRF